MERTTKPMLAALQRELPIGRYLYEPKWDGLRCLAFVERGKVDLRSRHGKPLARYFPELVEALVALGRDCVLDGEIVIVGERGFDFAALLNRTHPAASRVAKLSRETPATLIAFDLLAVDGAPLGVFEQRRRALIALVPEGDRLRPTLATEDPAVARGWLDHVGKGIDGVVAKAFDLPYLPNKRAMIKVKRVRTVDCVLAGFRVLRDGPSVSSLLLGLWEGDELRHVGVCSQFTRERRRELVRELVPLITGFDGHPWQRGFNVGRSPMGRLPGAAGRWDPEEMVADWIPLRPERVVEVTYDHLDAQRFRHPARFVRWRPDREPRSCTFEQLSVIDVAAAGAAGAA
ncbi:MAG TPA: ATP-dependent DNA ligase [Kofleriaceae bacterium]|nr:ATP-dependent DNA ligase [Kofleriaceae bacterium]